MHLRALPPTHRDHVKGLPSHAALRILHFTSHRLLTLGSSISITSQILNSTPANLQICKNHNVFRLSHHRSRPGNRRVYRVYDDSSVSQHPEDGRYGFRAGAGLVSISGQQELHEAIESHTNHRNREPTPFISSSSDENWILREARRREDKGCENVRIAWIDLTPNLIDDPVSRYLRFGPSFRGEGVDVYNLEELIKNVGAGISKRTRQRYKHEWLFVGRIPKKVIEEVFTVDDFSDYCEYLGNQPPLFYC